MRLVAGSRKGKRLAVPAGRDVRPTGERARAALFNILTHGLFAGRLAGARLADLFAGTGALGLEALSRGGASALFVESDRATAQVLRANIAACDFTARSTVQIGDAARLPAHRGAPFDLVFADPPYHQDLLPPCLAALRDGNWLAANALIIAEQAADEVPVMVPGFARLDRRLYGAAQIGFLAYHAGDLE